MNINLTTSTSVNLSTTDVRAAKSTASQTQTPSIPQDRTTLHSVSNLVATALQQPSVRADKVAAIQQSLAAGTYTVSPHKIAAAIDGEM
jgi:flagellar biosynthesis anti-sigma factor FlgM